MKKLTDADIKCVPTANDIWKLGKGVLSLVSS